MQRTLAVAGVRFRLNNTVFIYLGASCGPGYSLVSFLAMLEKDTASIPRATSTCIDNAIFKKAKPS